MDFSLSTEQTLIKDNARRFLAERVSPLIDDAEARGEFPWEILPELKDFGYIGGLLPEKDGGSGLGYVDWTVLMEEAGYCWLGLRIIVNTININARLLNQHGTEDQKARFLRPLLDCTKRLWVGITEPNHGSDVSSIETRAVDMGDHFVINGNKQWITNGIFGDFGILVAKTYSKEMGLNGEISLFLIDKEETEYEAQRAPVMFAKSTATSVLSFNDAIVPKNNLLGKPGDGLRQILAGLNYGRLNVAVGAVGAAQCALDLSIQYAKDRKQFGKPIGSYQLIQKHIVDMKVKTEAARALTYRAAWLMEQGETARLECSIAKLFSTEAAHEVANKALQVHGGLGYSAEYPIERIFRDTRGGIIPEGTSEIQTLIIGREILGISAFN